MKEEAMPEAIKDLIEDSQVSGTGKDRFIRDFDVKPNVILYHTHVVPMKEMQQKNQDWSSHTHMQQMWGIEVAFKSCLALCFQISTKSLKPYVAFNPAVYLVILLLINFQLLAFDEFLTIILQNIHSFLFIISWATFPHRLFGGSRRLN